MGGKKNKLSMTNNDDLILILRLYDGLRSSIRNNDWNPTGVPAIYKLIETLSRSNIKFKIYFYLLDQDYRFHKNEELFINQLNLNVKILTSPIKSKLIFGKIKTIVDLFYFSLISLYIASKNKPKLIYTDRGNILGACLISKFVNVDIIVRLLGITTDFYNFMKSGTILSKIFKYAYKSNFNTIISTQDGSSINTFLDEFINCNTKTYLKINGINKKKFASLKNNKKLIIFAVGRIEEKKGIDVLINTTSMLPKMVRENIKINIIGDGSKIKKMQTLCNRKKVDNIINFFGPIKHEKINDYLLKGDLYISLNNYGQLSNSNLDAIGSGLCLIFSETKRENDSILKKMGLTEERVFWIKQDSSEKHLSKIITYLVKNKNKITQYKKFSRKIAFNIPLMSDRMMWEKNLIKKHLKRS